MASTPVSSQIGVFLFALCLLFLFALFLLCLSSVSSCSLMDFNNIPPFNTSTTTTTTVTTTTNTTISSINPPLFPNPFPLYHQQTFLSNFPNFQDQYYQSNLLHTPQSIFPINPFSETGVQNAQPLGGFSSFDPPSMMFPMHPLPQMGAQNPLPVSDFFDGCAQYNQIHQNFGLLPNVHLPKQSNPSKEAREKRRMARKMRSSISHNKPKPPSSSSSSSSTSNIPKMPKKTPAPVNNNEEEDLYIHATFDGIKLKFLLQKVLQKTDVGSLGRIILPKKAAEENLPWLNEKEGIQIMPREADSTQMWHMRYRFWPNNDSRMYVLDGTGEYVKHHELKYRDILMIYEDEKKQLYISYLRAEVIISVPQEEDNSNTELTVNTLPEQITEISDNTHPHNIFDGVGPYMFDVEGPSSLNQLAVDNMEEDTPLQLGGSSVSTDFKSYDFGKMDEIPNFDIDLFLNDDSMEETHKDDEEKKE